MWFYWAAVASISMNSIGTIPPTAARAHRCFDQRDHHFAGEAKIVRKNVGEIETCKTLYNQERYWKTLEWSETRQKLPNSWAVTVLIYHDQSLVCARGSWRDSTNRIYRLECCPCLVLDLGLDWSRKSRSCTVPSFVPKKFSTKLLRFTAFKTHDVNAAIIQEWVRATPYLLRTPFDLGNHIVPVLLGVKGSGAHVHSQTLHAINPLMRVGIIGMRLALSFVRSLVRVPKRHWVQQEVVTLPRRSGISCS